MPSAWRFIDHSTSQDAATRTLIRATVARNQRMKERMRATRQYLEDDMSNKNQLASKHPSNDGYHEERMMVSCTNCEPQASTIRSAFSHEPTAVIPTFDKDETASREQSIARHSAQTLQAHSPACALVSTCLDPFATDSPVMSYDADHWKLLQYCKRHLCPSVFN